MSLRDNKARADRLVRQAQAERLARREHVARAAGIFRRRLGSPRGLALSFAAGAVTGLRLRRREARADARRAAAEGEDGRQEGFLGRLLDNPVASIGLRLATATIVRSIFAPGAAEGGGADIDAGDAAGY